MRIRLSQAGGPGLTHLGHDALDGLQVPNNGAGVAHAPVGLRGGGQDVVSGVDVDGEDGSNYRSEDAPA